MNNYMIKQHIMNLCGSFFCHYYIKELNARNFKDLVENDETWEMAINILNDGKQHIQYPYSNDMFDNIIGLSKKCAKKMVCTKKKEICEIGKNRELCCIISFHLFLSWFLIMSFENFLKDIRFGFWCKNIDELSPRTVDFALLLKGNIWLEIVTNYKSDNIKESKLSCPNDPYKISNYVLKNIDFQIQDIYI